LRRNQIRNPNIEIPQSGTSSKFILLVQDKFGNKGISNVLNIVLEFMFS